MISKSELKRLRSQGLSDLEIAAIKNKAAGKKITSAKDIFRDRRRYALLTDEEIYQIRQARRRLIKGIGIAGTALAAGGGALAVFKYFSDDDLYERAKNDTTLQERWVRRILSKYGIENLFSEVIIVTPQNAHKYENEYNRSEKVGQTSADITVAWQVDSFEHLGTSKAPLPKLYVPTELFRLASKGDLKSTIAFHEASHARVIRHGFESSAMDEELKFHICL